MINFWQKVSLFFGVVLFLAGCAIPFSTQRTQIIKSPNNTEEKQNNTEVKIQNNIEAKQNNIETKNNSDTELRSQNKIEKKQNDTEKISNDAIITETENAPKITNKLVSWGFSKSENRTIDTVIIHSSFNAVGSDSHNLEDIIYKEYKPAGVSPHYIISWEGKIYRLVEDNNIAYHAGQSKVPDGRIGVNDFSIGIEIVNTKSEKPNDAQYGAVKNLVAYLKEKYKIKYVLGHSDIAPSRKDDPWNFDWGRIK